MIRAARLLALLAIALLSTLACQSALAYWTSAGEEGDGIAGALTVNQGATPRATELASTSVTVDWGAGTLSNGVPVAGYIIQRYDEATEALATIGSGCAGTITALTCTEAEVPEGEWQYSVTPVFSEHWRGPESLKSGTVDTRPGVMTVSRTLFGGTVAPLPAVVTGTVSDFPAEEAISFFLDGTVPLSGTPAQVGAGGTASYSLTLPAGTADGPHKLSIKSSGTEASTGILVDNTAPTIELFVNPAPNAAGWNNTSPVVVTGKVDDGNGSGVKLERYTTDGTDPKTSPTAQSVVGGAVTVTETTTLKGYLTDSAGNESEVETLQVNIDTAPPLFTIGATEVHGGFFQTAGNIETGAPGVAYYRGVEAGSVRFVITPEALGGSPPVSAGFSALPAEAVGFSLDSSSVTTPVGGPYVSSPLSWVAGTTSVASGTISLTDEAGNTVGGPGTTVNDSTPPRGGSVEATGLVGTAGLYSNSLILNLQLAKGTDSGSGLADGTGPSDIADKLLRASAPLTSVNGVAAGTCGTFSAFTQVGSGEPAASVSETIPTDNTCYLYHYLVYDHVGNVATYASTEVKVQATVSSSLQPTAAVLTPITGVGAQSVSGSTVFYNPAQLGSFNVESSAAAPYTGIAQMSFPAITGFNGGGVVTSPVTGTTFRATYSWSANGDTPSPGPQALTATDNSGQSSTNPSAFTVVKDEAGPTGGSVEATGLEGTGGRYSTSLTVKLALAPGTDAGAGLAASGAQLLRASAGLTSSGTANGICGTFGAYTQVGANDPATPVSDVVPVDRTCYRYEYVVPDKVGNLTVYTSGEIKVDATAPPAPALSFAALTNAYWSGTGTAVYYRPGASGGGFQVTASSLDTSAGTSAYAFPALPTGWTASSGGSGAETYSWSTANPVAPSGAVSVTATNYAGLAATSTFTATPDSTAPAGGSVSYVNGSTTATSATITLVAATDSGSGIATALLERASAILSAGSCGAFGAFATIATSPASTVSDPVTAGNCYQYRYVVTDNVGNQSIFTSASVLKVETALTNSLTLTNPVGSYLSAGNLYYNSNSVGSFVIRDALAGGAGPASVTYPVISLSGWTHPTQTVTTPTGGPYSSTTFSWTAHPSSPGTYTVTGKDTLGAAVATALTFVSDQSPPTGGSITYLNGTVKALSVTITTADGTDSGSGINAEAGIVKRDEATLNTTTEVCGTFPGTFATTVTLVGGADTSVTNGHCYQYRYLASDNVGNQATYTSANIVKVDTTGPQVTAITSLQSSGSAGNGKLEVGDKLILTFDQALAASSVPTTFSGATETSPGSTQDVTLTIPGVSSGALDTGSRSYLAAASTTATFGGTATLANNGTATTVTLAVTSLSGAATAASTGALVFKPATTITEAGGIAASGSFTSQSNFKLF